MTIPKKIRPEFSDADVAHAYVDEFLNVSIATQLKVLREQREMTQEELARASGMKQERISVLESVNYSSWSINTLRKLAKALDVRLKVSFETFGSYFSDFERFSREGLQRLSRAEEIELERLTAVALASREVVRSVTGYGVVCVVAEPALTALESALAEAGYDLTDEELAQSEEQRGG